MAEDLSRARLFQAAFCQRSIGLILFGLATGAIGAEDPLRDPTRPPASLASAEQSENAAPVPSGPLLQSVLIGPSRTLAIISGRTVRVGDRVGSAEVTAIREGEVVLRTGSNSRVLKLFPRLDKKVLPSTSAATK